MKIYGNTPCPMGVARAFMKHQHTPLGCAIIKATNGRFEEMPAFGGASTVNVSHIVNFDRRLQVLAKSSSIEDHELLKQVYKLPKHVERR